MTREDKQMLCACGHKRAAHFGKEHEGDCAATTEGFNFCSCKSFRAYQFKSEEEIEMAKKASKSKAPKGERKPRERKAYQFNVERARELRDARYSTEAKAESKVGLMLRALISSNSDSYTADRIFELANNNGAKLEDVNVLPIGTLVTYGVLSLTNGKKIAPKKIVPVGEKKAIKPKAEKKAKKARKPRKAKSEATSTEAQTQEAAA